MSTTASCHQKERVELLTFSQTSPGFFFKCLQYKSFENTEGKGKIARNKQFLLPPPPVFFYPFGELSAIFNKLGIIVCKLFQFGGV